MALTNKPMDYYRNDQQTAASQTVEALDRAMTEAWIYADRAERRRAKLRRAADMIDELKAERASLHRRLHRAEVERDLAAANGRALRLHVEHLGEVVRRVQKQERAGQWLLLVLLVAFAAFTMLGCADADEPTLSELCEDWAAGDDALVLGPDGDLRLVDCRDWTCESEDLGWELCLPE